MTQAVISGVAHTHLGELPDMTDIGINIAAATEAVADAGLTMRGHRRPARAAAVLGLAALISMPIGESLGIYVKTLTDATSMGGASYGAMLQFAKWAIEDGSPRRTPARGRGREAAHRARVGLRDDGLGLGAHNLDWEYPFCATIPAYYALLAQRYLHEYGLGDDAIAPVAVTTRKHAMLNPAATMRTPLTLQDVLDSPMISTPLHRLECSLVSDGGAAWVISRKGTSGDPSREVQMLGLGAALSHYHMGHLARGDGQGPRPGAHGDRRRRQARVRAGPHDAGRRRPRDDLRLLHDHRHRAARGPRAGRSRRVGRVHPRGPHGPRRRAAAQHPRRPAELRRTPARAAGCCTTWRRCGSCAARPASARWTGARAPSSPPPSAVASNFSVGILGAAGT